jgi:hypothetical protein
MPSTIIYEFNYYLNLTKSNSVHLNDLKAVGVIGILVGVVVGFLVIGVVIAYHKYSRID